MGHMKASAQSIMANIKKYIEGIIKHEETEIDGYKANGIGMLTGTSLYFLKIDTYKIRSDGDYPQQDNCCDCGVFMLKGIDYISRNMTSNFSTRDMQYFRILITYELILGRLLTPDV